MELEEAIQTLKDFGMYGRYYSNNTEHHMKTAINIVLNHLTKQEKMIELMVQVLYDEDYEELICMEVDCDHITIQQEGKCIGKECIKQYFENKAEESE